MARPQRPNSCSPEPGRWEGGCPGSAQGFPISAHQTRMRARLHAAIVHNTAL
jgi:hypothetical protein